MKLRPPALNRVNMWERLRSIKYRDPKKGARLLDARFYIKPDYLPWRHEVWCTKHDVFLPCDFEEKDKIHQIQDLFRAGCLFEEQEMFREALGIFPFIWWVVSRKIGYIKSAANLRIRKKWRGFLEKGKL